MKELLHIGERNSVKEYGSNPWDTAHGITVGPIIVNERKETATPRQILQGNDSYANPTRGVVINTLQFDAELIPVFTETPPPVPEYNLQAFIMKAEDLERFFMPTQEYDAKHKFGLLTCDLVSPRVNIHNFGLHDYTDIHYDPSQNPWLGVYVANDVYKHYFHTFPGRYTCAALIKAGYDLTGALALNVLGYTYGWFAINPTPVDLVIVQFYGFPTFTAAQYAEILAHPNTCNVAFCTYDGNSVNSISANADIIRGNKWSQADTDQSRPQD